MMLSIEKAKALKEAGLLREWEPGDFFVLGWGADEAEPEVQVCHEGYSGRFYGDEEDIWLPSLSQLLEEIKARGYTWEMGTGMVHGGPLDPVMRQAGYWCEAFLGNKLAHRVTRAETPEDAAAGVLLAILRRDETYCAVGK